MTVKKFRMFSLITGKISYFFELYIINEPFIITITVLIATVDTTTTIFYTVNRSVNVRIELVTFTDVSSLSKLGGGGVCCGDKLRLNKHDWLCVCGKIGLNPSTNSKMNP